MKFQKFFLTSILFLVLLINSYSKPSAQGLPNVKSPKIEVSRTALSSYIEYHEIEGIIWAFEYDTDGKLIRSYPLE